MSSAIPHRLANAREAVGTGALHMRVATGASPRILDVRTPAEFEAAHIPGSYNVPLDTVREHRDELIVYLDDDFLPVCRPGMRAQQVERTFVEAGLGNVHVLRGGITQWEADGGKLNGGRRRWDLERQAPFITIVGGGLVFAALTNSCAMEAVLRKLPFKRGAVSCDIDTVVADLAGSATGHAT